MQKKEWFDSSWGRVLLNAFILLHLYIIVTWGLPGSNFRMVMTDPVQDYVIDIGLWHSWDMFSPDPLSVNFSVEAEIIHKNGLSETWEFPRMEKLGMWDKFQMERYRKWRERVRQDAYAGIWNDTCSYIAREHNKDPNNPPIRVILTRRWLPIPPPRTLPGKRKMEDFQPIPDHYDLKFSYRFKTYEVQPTDL